MNVYRELADYFGSQKKAAEALYVSQPLVCQWIDGSRSMSPVTALIAEKKTGGKFTREQLCPDFPWEDARK